MNVRRLIVVPIVALMLTGCGGHEAPNAKSAMAVQLLPRSIAEKPLKISAPYWQVRNPHVFIRNSAGKVIFYSNGFWNGKTIEVYYVPESSIRLYRGEYSLHDGYPAQRLTQARIVDGQFVASWNIKGHALPKRFYILAKTNTGNATIEKARWDGHQVVISGGESPVH